MTRGPIYCRSHCDKKKKKIDPRAKPKRKTKSYSISWSCSTLFCKTAKFQYAYKVELRQGTSASHACERFRSRPAAINKEQQLSSITRPKKSNKQV